MIHLWLKVQIVSFYLRNKWLPRCFFLLARCALCCFVGTGMRAFSI
uniref:Uncharacterized protein n=1 Tax=Anguilla anguilla TaxID=7936 RepID=A0A0E9VGH0_ANGAN